MKKACISFFVVVMMLMLPITAVSQTVQVLNIETITNGEVEVPEFRISLSERDELVNFIETSFTEEDKPEAYTLLNKIVTEVEEPGDSVDIYDVDPIELADALTVYVYEPINETELNNVKTPEDLTDLLDTYWGVTPSGFIENLFSGLFAENPLTKPRWQCILQLVNS